MGNYNPHAPIILGQEWVPIRDENAVFSPAVNSVELGHQFQTYASRTLATARFYINELQTASDRGQTFMAAIYPAGSEDQTGPISRLVTPCNSVILTNATVSSGAGSAVEALATQSSNSGISLDTSQPDAGIALGFNLNGTPVLTGKRILGVNLLTGQAGSQDITGPLRNVNTSLIIVSTTSTIGSSATPNAVFGRMVLEGSTEGIQTTPFGEINQFWTANSPTTIADRVPWVYGQLQRLDATATRLFTRIETGTNRGTTANSSLYIYYAALEVIYCEEKRLFVGATQFGTSSAASSFGEQSILGANQIIMHDIATSALNPVMAAGSYSLMLSSADVGGLNNNQAQLTSAYPNLNAVRELYAITPHPGVQVAIPFPLLDHIGDPFTVDTIPSLRHILPQLSLHVSGTGTMTEPHVYGRQIAAQIYGANTATQDIYDDISGVNASYPQVRYYARRFGDTTVPLTLTGGAGFTGSTAQITVTDFDALPEILDGWREVTLRFATPPSMGAAAGSPTWIWSATSESGGNRWEVLGASAPAASGFAGDQFNLVPAPNRLYVGTYQPPAGDTNELTWMPQGVATQWVTSPSQDFSTDAVLMFSQDPTTITGVSLSQLTQTVSGIGSLCGSLPCCIPSGIGYNQITWPMAGGASLVEDSFSRTVVNGWGTPSEAGGAYAITDVATAYQVNGSEGLITPSVATTDVWATVDIGSPDFDVTAVVGVVGEIVAGSSARAILTGRFTNAASLYSCFIQQVQSTGALVLAIAGSGLTTAAVSTAIGSGGRINMRFMGAGSLLKAKVWPLGQDEPIAWAIEVTDTSITTGNRAGVGAQSRTNLGNVFGFDNLRITSPSYWFGAYEMQRYDSVVGDFETIMLGTDIGTTTFNDYEARVGLTSVYRIRNLNAYNFAGAWSTYVSGTSSAPGISGGSGCDMTGALIFTSNADQTGANNAAYIMQWDNTPTESFDFFEADEVAFQPMYGRAGRVAFHGTERGLEQFSRAVLLQAGAIALPSLADASDIRDLAWADLPYVCVRDDRGNLWYSNVRVAGVNARNNANNYLARLDITETTQTPFPVTP